MNEKLITILGPTASGKTDLAIELAQKYHGQIVCADSRTIYQGMDIGTAKPTIGQQAQAKHYLLDILEPNQRYSAQQFKIATQSAIKQIRTDGFQPLLVGGSGMYIDAVLFDYQFRDPRLHPDSRIDGVSLDELVARAKKNYPDDIQKIDIRNRRRVEQLLLKGPAKDDDRRNNQVSSLIIGLSPEKSTLQERIVLRSKNMLNNNFIQEVEKLRKHFGSELPALRTTGYHAVSKYLDGVIAKTDLADEIVKETGQLAKKQMTWFRRNKYITWIEDLSMADELVNKYLKG